VQTTKVHEFSKHSVIVFIGVAIPFCGGIFFQTEFHRLYLLVHWTLCLAFMDGYGVSHVFWVCGILLAVGVWIW
jgi:hypothetical protein